MLKIQSLTCRYFCDVCHWAEVPRPISVTGIALHQSHISPGEGINRALITSWGTRDEPDKCPEPGAHCPSWAQPPGPSTSAHSQNEASAAKNRPAVHPRKSIFLSENTAFYTRYCLRACILPRPLENVKPHTSRIQMNICTHIILYLSLWDSDNYSFRMGSKSTDLQRLFEVNIYLL